MTTARPPMNHMLKTWPQFYGEILAGRKRHEIRKHDRDFRVGDTLTLVEWSPETKAFTGAACVRVITYLSYDFPGIEKGYCLMSIAEVQQKGDESAALREELAGEQRRGDMHAELNRRAHLALGGTLSGEGSSWHDIPERIAKLTAEIEKARVFLDLDLGADDPRRKHGMSVIDVLLALCGEYESGIDAVMKKLKPNLSNDMPWEDEVIICYENVKQEADESAALLTNVANALKGQPLPLVPHDWDDLPKAAEALRSDLAVAKDDAARAWRNFNQERENRNDAEKDVARLDALLMECLVATRYFINGTQDKLTEAGQNGVPRAVRDRIAELVRERDAAVAKAEKLQAFKDFVHRRFDEIGITKEPNGKHSAEGCRVGDRIDEVAYLRQAALNVLAVIDNGEKDRVQPYNVYATIRTHLRHALKVPA
jgi:hypothetical protein